VEPISTNYRGYEVFQVPPNSQGIGVLIMLNMLEEHDLKEMGYQSPEYFHLLIEMSKLAYSDLYEYVADPEKNEFRLEEIKSKEYAAQRRKLINHNHAGSGFPPGLLSGRDTSYMTVIDEEGNAVSFIHSIYYPFGSTITGGETGILLQNRGYGFSLTPGHLNEYAPNKRPFNTIIPGMVLKDGKLYLSYGIMGGPIQVQAHTQFLVNHLDFGLNIQEALDAPRYNYLDGLRVQFEPGLPRRTLESLANMGHEIVPSTGGIFGGGQAIQVDPQTGTYFGASDSRKDGVALGY
jgi:gamma-glutamyltranspeptidase/glutathione hydrolase